MKSVQTKILGLLIGVSAFESVAEIDASGGEGSAVKFTNLYLTQKSAQVTGREKFAELLEKATGFPIKTKQVEVKDKTGKVTGTEAKWDENEGAYVNRFRAIAATPDGKDEATGEVIHGGITTAAGYLVDVGRTDAEIEAYLQSIADTVPVYTLSAKAAEREASDKKLPQYALEGADRIIGAGSQAKWVANFRKKSIEVDDFTTDDAAANRLALARGIVKYDAWMKANDNPYK